jgi:hypothetical protein
MYSYVVNFAVASWNLSTMVTSYVELRGCEFTQAALNQARDFRSRGIRGNLVELARSPRRPVDWYLHG